MKIWKKGARTKGLRRTKEVSQTIEVSGHELFFHPVIFVARGFMILVCQVGMGPAGPGLLIC